ncbi:MAG: hypothetical protein CVT48_02070 [Thermoplasmata archaeon HGW-Thermoplasmata-1]|nr:MAG: hypothetical protein CVT48_02070 [Thermoplasmata archaeon HGW-Thermoplasmata-1]
MTAIALSGCIGGQSGADGKSKPNFMEYNYEPQTPPYSEVELMDANGCSIRKMTFEGDDPLEGYVLENEYLYISILKDWGAKIYNCVFKPTAHDMAWKNEYARLLNPQLEKSRSGPIWQEYEIGGFDDCLPSVGECDYRNIHIPDHGESWLLPWEVKNVDNSSKRVSITMECTLKETPFKIEKTLTLFESQSRYLRHYKITNVGDEDWPFQWADHASIAPGGAVKTGDRMFLPDGTTLMVYFTKDGRMGEQGTIVDWPMAKQADGNWIDLSTLGPSELGYAEKFFTTELKEGWVAAADPAKSEALAFVWPKSVMPYAGVWIDQGGHRGYQQIALEATNAWGDCLNESVERFGKYGQLEPGESVEFDIWTSICGGISDIKRVTPSGIYIQSEIIAEGSKIVGKVSVPAKGTIEIYYEPPVALPTPGMERFQIFKIDTSPDKAVEISADALFPGTYVVEVWSAYGRLIETLCELGV